MNERNDDDKIDLAALTDQEERAINYLAKGDHKGAVALSMFTGNLEEYKAQWFARLTYGELPDLINSYQTQLKLDYTPTSAVIKHARA